jgi:hypothetical protein
VILIPYVIMSIFFVAFPFAEQIEIFDNPISQIRQAIEDEKITVSEAIATDDQTADVTIDVGVEPQINQAIALENKFGEGVIDKLVANFIYNFETYPKSACKKTAEQRSLIIDENMVLLAEKDDSPLGYRFFIAPCEGNFTSAESKAQTATQ